jgi:hypothetical protein
MDRSSSWIAFKAVADTVTAEGADDGTATDTVGRGAATDIVERERGEEEGLEHSQEEQQAQTMQPVKTDNSYSLRVSPSLHPQPVCWMFNRCGEVW